MADYERDATPLRLGASAVGAWRFVADYERDTTSLRFVADYEQRYSASLGI